MSTWDKTINNVAQRFRVLNAFNNEAVLDRETGLVWERSPSTQTLAWSNARLFCAQKAVGGRGGWRLPAFNELATFRCKNQFSNFSDCRRFSEIIGSTERALSLKIS